MRASSTVLCSLLIGLVGCASSIRSARMDTMAAPLPEEQRAAAQLADARCAPALGLLWPGLGHACLDEPIEAATLATLAGAEVTAGVALWQSEQPSRSLAPLVAAQNLWVISVVDVAITRQLAQQALYTPRDTLGELALAPFRPDVLTRPDTLLPTLGLIGGAALLITTTEPSMPGTPMLFGREVSPGAAWTGQLGLGAALFEHVAIGEEVAFRGLLQSQLARQHGEGTGWWSASLVFGLSHGLNALLIPPEERLEYLLIAVPWITVAGGTIGWTYRNSGYSLAPPVAMHFWYNLAVSAMSMARDPQNGMFSMRIGGHF